MPTSSTSTPARQSNTRADATWPRRRQPKRGVIPARSCSRRHVPPWLPGRNPTIGGCLSMLADRTKSTPEHIEAGLRGAGLPPWLGLEGGRDAGAPSRRPAASASTRKCSFEILRISTSSSTPTGPDRAQRRHPWNRAHRCIGRTRPSGAGLGIGRLGSLAGGPGTVVGAARHGYRCLGRRRRRRSRPGRPRRTTPRQPRDPRPASRPERWSPMSPASRCPCWVLPVTGSVS